MRPDLSPNEIPISCSLGPIPIQFHESLSLNFSSNVNQEAKVSEKNPLKMGISKDTTFISEHQSY